MIIVDELDPVGGKLKNNYRNWMKRKSWKSKNIIPYSSSYHQREHERKIHLCITTA